MAMLYLASVASNLGVLTTGLFSGWTSPALPLYDEDDSPVKLNTDEAAWVVALYTLGASISPIFAAAVGDKVGRKVLMLFSAIPSIISWIMIIFATTVWELYVARLLTGIATGVVYMITPMYLGEISPAKIRGFLLTSFMLASRVGILFVYSLVPFVSLTTSSIISMMIPIAFALSMIWLPESPYYLLRQGRIGAARRSLSLMRSGEDVEDELKAIEASIKAECNHRGGFRELLMVRGNRTALSISVILVVIQQLSGSQVITSYSESIFDETGSKVDGKYMTIILGIVQVICTGVCAIVVDRYGRRVLLLLSVIGSCVSTGFVAIYFNVKHVNGSTSYIEWLPSTGCILFIIFYSIGLSGLPFTMIGELFPMNVKPLGSTIGTVACNLTAFAITKSYAMIEGAAGVHVSFWIYCVCNFISIFYIYFCVPETRKKTLQEIQQALNTKGKGSKGVSHRKI